MVYHPTTKVLAVLELLQTHGHLSGPAIARRLEIGERSVRRYITTLQDLGVPVESERGRYGSYRLRPSYKLPPLMFSEDEALVLTLGLHLIRRSGLAGSALDAEGALAKVERVLPERLRTRMRALQEVVALDIASWNTHTASRTLVTLSEAVHQNRQVRLHYRSFHDEATERAINPYGVAWRYGRWYTVGYCHLRQDVRVFRLDRIDTVTLCDETFTHPPAFDVLAHIEQVLATAPIGLAIEVLFETTLAHVQNSIRWLPGTLEETPDGVLFKSYAYDEQALNRIAHFLIGLGYPVIVRHPPALRTEIERLARHVAEIARRSACDHPTS